MWIWAAPIIVGVAARPVVLTDDGPIVGVLQADGVSQFLSVPFAAPPVGQLRWRAPQRPSNWSTPLDVSVSKDECYQQDFLKGTGKGGEDCLYLSVYSPPACMAAVGNASARCATLFWVHGGGWLLGDDIGHGGGYNGSALALAHDVVVVAVSYRLDALGWMALREFAEESPDGKVCMGVSGSAVGKAPHTTRQPPHLIHARCY
jgi:para-nitrobenzyl esterase